MRVWTWVSDERPLREIAGVTLIISGEGERCGGGEEATSTTSISVSLTLAGLASLGSSTLLTLEVVAVIAVEI